MENQRHPGVHFVAGLALIAGGVLLTLDNLGWIHGISVFSLWPLMPLGVGAQMIVNPQKAGQRRDGAWVVLVGAFFLESNLGLTGLGWSALLPVFIIVVGLMLIWQGTAGREKGHILENRNGA